MPTVAACGFNITEYPLPTANSAPDYITAGPDGAVWFVENGSNKVGRMTSGGGLTEYPIPTPSSGPQGIALGSDGALWFTEVTGAKIRRITTSGSITEYTGGGNFFRPWTIAPGPDGALWFTDEDSGDVGEITTSGVASPEYNVPGHGAGDDREPYGLVAGPDGAMWITDFLGYIDRMTTSGTVTNEYSLSGGEPDEIAIGADGALWFSLSFQYAIGRITTAGSLTFEPTPQIGGRSYSNGIALGPDGAMWFALNASAIGRITTSGAVEECPTPTQVPGGTVLPFGMTAGPGGLWFTENLGNNIGFIPDGASGPLVRTRRR